MQERIKESSQEMRQLAGERLKTVGLFCIIYSTLLDDTNEIRQIHRKDVSSIR